jgi:spermidine dehydrogenase
MEDRMSRSNDQKLNARDAERLGLGAQIDRRDFIGGTLIGAGASLLASAAPWASLAAHAQESSEFPPIRGSGADWTGTEFPDDWLGPGGVGDYASANGNTPDVVRAAHAGVRNHAFEKKLAAATDTNETYDVVIVGAGVSGLFGAYDLLKQQPNAKLLILDDHAIFGGEAKHNQIDVDGHSLYGTQGPSIYGSSDVSSADDPFIQELGLPVDVTYTEVTGLSKPLRVPWDYWSPQSDWTQVDVGYFYDSTGFVRNPFENAFRDAPIDQKIKDDIARILAADQSGEQPVEPEGDPFAWLDSMTYQEFLELVYGAHPDTGEILDSIVTTGVAGVGADLFSAAFGPFGTIPYTGGPSGEGSFGIGFPTGNSGVARTILKKFLPGVIPGDTLTDLLFGPVAWDQLDNASNNARIRLNSTVVGVRQDEAAGNVTTYYLLEDKLYRVTSKVVIMATPQQVNRNVVFDLPQAYDDAMAQFMHGPILVLNIALRQWKFMEQAEITAFRWFGNYPAYGQIERRMRIDGRDIMPCDPSKPTMVTLYIPMNELFRGKTSLMEQTFGARHVLFGLKFSDIELMIRDQLTKMFEPYGFDASRDIAGLVANRWGHALVASGPGFITGMNGAPPPSATLTQPFGRIAFSHSDLGGVQHWEGATEGARAAVENLISYL